MMRRVQMLPHSTTNPRKSLSLRERMSLHLQPQSSPNAAHLLTSQQHSAQHSGHAPPPSSPVTSLPPAPAKEADDSGSSHQQTSMLGFIAEQPLKGGHASAEAAAEREVTDSRACGTGSACQASGEDSDTDMTQEDLPLLPEPCDKEQGAEVVHQQDMQLQGSVHRHPDRPQLHRGGAQEQQCWQQEEEVMPVSTADPDQSRSSCPRCSESQVIHLEDESADDLLDVLAEAAAEAPAAAQVIAHDLVNHRYHLQQSLALPGLDNTPRHESLHTDCRQYQALTESILVSPALPQKQQSFACQQGTNSLRHSSCKHNGCPKIRGRMEVWWQLLLTLHARQAQMCGAHAGWIRNHMYGWLMTKHQGLLQLLRQLPSRGALQQLLLLACTRQPPACQVCVTSFSVKLVSEHM